MMFRLRCARCGDLFYGNTCVHNGTAVEDMTDDEAARVRARYAIGKKHNPNHDETSYRDRAQPQRKRRSKKS